MAAVIVEHARFVEVRQRRARIAAELDDLPPEPTVAASKPESVDDHAVEAGVSHVDPSLTRGRFDVG